MNNTGDPARVNISIRAASSRKFLLKCYGIKDSTKNEAKLVLSAIENNVHKA